MSGEIVISDAEGKKLIEDSKTLKNKMSNFMAERIAAFAFGPSAQCIRHKDPKHRDRRFAIYFTDDPPEDKAKEGFKQAVYVAGHGDSWESAFKMANENPLAQAKSKKVTEMRKELQTRMVEEDQKKFEEVKKEIIKDSKRLNTKFVKRSRKSRGKRWAR